MNFSNFKFQISDFRGLFLRGRSVVDQEPHKLPVGGSIPSPATLLAGAQPNEVIAGGTAAGSWHSRLRLAFWPVRPTAHFRASEIPAPIVAVIVGGLAIFRRRARRGVLAVRPPVCHDLREEPAVIPLGALARTIRRVA